MQDSKQFLAYDESSQTFAGVGFLLVGFDFDKENKVRSKLLAGGATDAVIYGPNCTHVIVDKLVYDDLVCVDARRDGKTLVTSTWVDHSFDLGVLVDPNSVMYRPVRDLNGIPGAKSFVVCLTGYQRQDREDIMTMVSLMGANFSKPLVANKVTHLICYKFEGEKYELAKKLKRIKLVNHCWLEDCLKAWEILPETEYCKSGYELEMEAEAKDSEEETEDVASLADSRTKNAACHPNTSIEKMASLQSSVKPEISRNRLSLTPPKTSATMADTGIKSTPAKEDDMGNTSAYSRETRHTNQAMRSSVSGRSPWKIPFEVPPNRLEETMMSDKIEDVLASMSKSAKKSPSIDKTESNSNNHFSSNQKKTSLPLVLGRTESNFQSPSASDVNKSWVGGDFGLPLNLHEGESDVAVNKTPLEKKSLPLVNEGQKSTLFYKRKSTGSHGSSKSLKLSHRSEMLLENTFDLATKKLLVSESSLDGPREISRELDISTPSRKAPVFRQEHGDDGIQHYHERLKASSALDVMDKCSSHADELEIEIPRAQSIEPSLRGNRSCEENLDAEPDVVVSKVERHVDKRNSLRGNHSCDENLDAEADVVVSKVERGSDKRKPVKNKLLARKPFNSRPSVTEGNDKEVKGSIELHRVVIRNDLPDIEAENNCASAIIKEKLTTSDDAGQTRLINSSDKPHEEAIDHGPSNLETTALDNSGHNKIDRGSEKTKPAEVKSPCSDMRPVRGKGQTTTVVRKQGTKPIEDKKVVEAECIGSSKKAELSGSNAKSDTGDHKLAEAKKRPMAKSKASKVKDSRTEIVTDGSNKKKEGKDKKNSDSEAAALLADITTKARPSKKLKSSKGAEKENRPVTIRQHSAENQTASVTEEVVKKSTKETERVDTNCRITWFILSGHRLQRKEFQQVIKRLKGRVCRDSHNWSYQATHFIVPDPIRRTEKFFAAAASGSWILKTDYLTASNEAGKFLPEEPHEWHKKCLSEDGAINLEAPRKWRLLRERTGHGAFYEMRVVVYGECIAPPLDTLKRVIKAGDGTILATSPPYTRFFQSRVDFAIVCPGMPRADMWVQEFLTHEIPCVSADYLVEYVCKPGYSLDKHVLYNTHDWAKRSLENVTKRVEEIDRGDDDDDNDDGGPTTPQDQIMKDDVACRVCGSGDRGEELLICGDESGELGCGVGMHLDCIDPPLIDVPEEDWFCPDCTKKRISQEQPSTRRASRLDK